MRSLTESVSIAPMPCAAAGLWSLCWRIYYPGAFSFVSRSVHLEVHLEVVKGVSMLKSELNNLISRNINELTT